VAEGGQLVLDCVDYVGCGRGGRLLGQFVQVNNFSGECHCYLMQLELKKKKFYSNEIISQQIPSRKLLLKIYEK